ncbi:DUF6090 family protein [Sediminicola luteus]|uniref:DUF6090 family protein n=1 Tax=Sediminicola luteus TaxID=319238 RepID=A0ABV2TXB8_9FLAO
MIKFFRRIRQRLLSENKFSKYLIYAIGEIILVVIGILIALALNNWNSDSKAKTQELSLLAEMRENLESDLIDCQYNIRVNERLHISNKLVLQELEARNPFHDSLKLHYGRLWGGTTQTMNTSAYDNLNSIGFDLIRNNSLRRSITVLYSERYPYLKRLESDFDNKIQMNEMLPQINAKIVIDSMWQSGYPIDFNALMNDDAFKGLLRNNIFVRSFMIGKYTDIENQLKDLLGKIERELESRQR